MSGMGISVLMSVYNGDNPFFLEQALCSILWQTRRPEEVVIVVDGPISDEITSVITEFSNRALTRVVRSDVNVGVGAALRLGAEFCSYPFIARMDADDISSPERFERQLVEFEKDSSLAMVGTQAAEFFDANASSLRLRGVPVSDEDVVRFSKSRNPITHPTIMFRKDVYNRVGGYRDVLYFEDYDLVLRFLKSGWTVRNLPSIEFYVRWTPGTFSRRRGVAYANREFEFYRIAYRERNLPASRVIYSLCIRLPVRLLPRFVVRFVYTVMKGRPKSSTGSVGPVDVGRLSLRHYPNEPKLARGAARVCCA